MVVYATVGILCRFLLWYANTYPSRCREPEASERVVPVLEQRAGARRTGCTHVALEETAQARGVGEADLPELSELHVEEPLVGVEEEELSTRHPGAHVSAMRAEHDDDAVRHVLARVVA